MSESANLPNDVAQELENIVDCSSKKEVENDSEPNNQLNDDPYAYLERDEFSSEKFKIEIKNLPRFYGINELRKLLNNKLSLASNKIKLPRKNSPYVFVCFRNDEDRDNAIKVIKDYKWKGKVLNAMKATPAPDPLVKKRKEDSSNDNSTKRLKLDAKSQVEQLKTSTIPLWNVAYEQQLKIKQDEIKVLLKRLGNDLVHHNPNVKKWIENQKSLHRGLPCQLLDIRYSESLQEYRNKCEFTVGMDEVTGLPTVGFRIGSYATGLTGVGAVDELNHIPQNMKTAVKVFQDFVRSSDLKVFNPELQTGHFRQLTVRHATDQLMLVVGIHPQLLSDEELAKLKSDLKQLFFEGPGKEAKVTSLYYQVIVKKSFNDDIILPIHLGGDTHIYETILGLKFRISPQAFFQTNTKGAEVLYKSAIELSEPTPNSTVVDICCGTGTIGLCFAKHCSQVLGLELVPQAIVDAKENAKINSIDNCEFFAGKAEEILNSVLYRAKNEDVIAVVDPPRAGLHKKAVMQLRNSKKVNKLVYVSCNPNAALKNFVDFGRPTSKVLQGEPFLPVKAVAVDMFPHTKHCELIVYFKRFSEVVSNCPQQSTNEST